MATRPNGIKDEFSRLHPISTKVGQSYRSRSKALLHTEEVHPIMQLSKYGSNPLMDKENRASEPKGQSKVKPHWTAIGQTKPTRTSSIQ